MPNPDGSPTSAELDALAVSVRNGTTPADSTVAATCYRYPNNLTQPPYEKYIMFRAKKGRHLLRSQILVEDNGKDDDLASCALYLPDSALSSKMSVEWAKNDLGMGWGAAIEMAGQTAQDIGTWLSKPTMEVNIGQGVVGKLSSLGADGLSNFGKLAAQIGIDAIQVATQAVAADVLKGVESLLPGAGGALVGAKVNPRTDLMFDCQTYRTHTLDFLLVPRDQGEADMIDNIIHMFQFYMLPRYQTNANIEETLKVGSFLIGFPYEFEIDMYALNGTNGGKLDHINQIGRSILKSVDIDHASGGEGSKGGVAFIKTKTDYYPVATKLTLEFMEVVLLARDSEIINRKNIDWTKGADRATYDPRKL